jgi:hypothetical protein
MTPYGAMFGVRGELLREASMTSRRFPGKSSRYREASRRWMRAFPAPNLPDKCQGTA